MNEQLLRDFVATAEYHNYDWETVFSKFPELQGYDQQALKDYAATAKYNNYDFGITNSKFPEFNQAPQQEEPGMIQSAITYVKGLFDQSKEDEFDNVGQVIPDALKKKEEQGSTELPSAESSLVSPSSPKTTTQTTNFFDDLLNSITPELIDEDEDDIEDKLGKKLSPYGVKVEQDKRFREAIKLSVGEEGQPGYKEISVPVDNFFGDNDKKSAIDLKKWLLENTNKEKINEQQLVSEEFQKATLNEQGFNKGLGGINADLISKDAESIVPQLTAMFGGYGIGDNKFKFEEVGITDNIKVTAPNGKVFVTEVDAMTEAGDLKIAADLKRFMEENKPALLKAEDNLNKYATTFLSEKEMEEATKSFSLESENFKNDVNSALLEKKALEKGRGKMSPEEYNQRTQALNEKIKSISEKEGQLNANKLMLDKSLANYVEWRSEQGGVVGSIWNSLIGGYGSQSSGITGFFGDIALSIAPADVMIKDYKRKFLEEAIQNGIDVPSLKMSESDFDKWTETLPENVKNSIESKVVDNAKKEFKKEVAFPSGKALVKTLGVSEVTPEYMEKAQKTTVLQGGAMGVAGSLPAIAGSIAGPGGGKLTVAQFALQGYDATMQEMSGEKFEDIPENEKYLVAVPVAILNGVLEEYGFRNMIGKSGVTTSILSSVMGKAGKKATASTFKELVENEVESRVARGLLTLGAAGLSEAETGATQQLGELGIKEIYNKAREKELFQTPNGVSGWLDEIGESAKQEAIGGMIMGSIGAVSTAATDNNYNGVSDETLQKIEALRDDETIRKAYVANLKYEIASGNKTKEQAQAELDGYNKSISIYNQIPTDLSNAAKRKAYGLLKEKSVLEASIQGKDASLVKKQNERINEIKDELSKLPELRDEGVQEASYSINGEQMSEQDFTNAISEMSDEDIKTADIKATNATEGVTSLLQDVARRSGVDSAPMMETTAPQEKAELSSNKKMGELSTELQNEIDDSGLISQGPIGDMAENKSVGEAIDNKIEYHQLVLERENAQQNPDANVVNENTEAISKLNDLKAKVEQENLAPTADEVAAAETVAKAKAKAAEKNKTTAKPKTLDEIQDEEARDFLLSGLNDYEDAVKGRKERGDEFVKNKPSILKPFAKLSRAIVDRLPIPANKRDAYYKQKAEQIKNNPEQYINELVTRYENYKEEQGEDFQDEGYLNYLKKIESKIKKETPTTLEQELREKLDYDSYEKKLNSEFEWEREHAKEFLADPKAYFEKYIEIAKRNLENHPNNENSKSVLDYNTEQLRIFNEITNKYKENAIQEPTTEEGVLRTEQSQVGLPTVGQGNTQQATTEEGVTTQKTQEVKPIEQEVSELEQMFPTEGPTGENRGVAASNNQAMDEMASRATDERVKKVIKTAQRLTKTLKSLFPTADINLHETEDSYNGAMEEMNGVKGSNGNFAFGIDANGKPFVRIDINTSSATSTDVAHEVAHAVLQKAFGDNQKLFRSFQEKIAKVLSTESNQALLDFANNPVYREQGVTYEEYMVQLKALLSEQGAKLELSTAKKIAAVINEYVSRITKGAFKPFQEVTDVKQVIDFVNKVTDAMAKGEAIDVESVSNIGEPISRSSIKNIDVNKIRTLSRAGNRVSKGLAINTVNKQKVVQEAEDLSLEYVREKAPELFIKNADLISKYPIVQGIKKFGEIKNMQDAQEVYDIFARQIADNLKYLMDNFKKEFRDIATLWYDGANILAQNFSKKYGISTEQAAGIMASLSPQKDWYQNVRLAELVMMAFKENPVMTQEMVDKQRIIRNEGFKQYAKKLTKAQLAYKKSRSKVNAENLKKQIEKNEKYNKKTEIILEKLSNLIGSDMNSVPPEMKGYYVRLFHEINTTKDYDVLSPDGSVIGIAKNDDGTNSKVAWGSYGEIGKAVSIYLDGSQENITRTLGEMHKIRNFYNNIIDPMSPDKDVTMDTHAVAAALMLPLSGNTKQVEANFGTGTSNSAPLGIKGLYYAYAEGYNLAAEEVGLLPRQVQSITWEAVRGLFTDKFKTSKANIAGINEIVENYVNKKITLDEARNQITEYAGGIKDPSWAGGPLQEESTDNVKRGAVGRGSRRNGPDTVGTKRGGQGGIISRSSLRQEGKPEIQVKKSDDFLMDGEHVVYKNGEPIGRIFYDRSYKGWKNAEFYGGFEKPGTFKWIYGDVLGDTKQEAVDEIVRRNNELKKEEAKKEENKVSFTKDNILNTFLNKLNDISPLLKNPFGDGFVYDDRAQLKFNRFDKGDKNEVELQTVTTFEKGKGQGAAVMKDITDAADKAGVTLTLEAKPFGRDGLSKKDLIDFYKKNGFVVDYKEAYGGEFESEQELIDYALEYESEGVPMKREPKGLTSRSSLRTQTQVDDIVKQARASGYSEKAIEEFLKKRGVAQEKIDSALGKKAAATKIVLNEGMLPGYDRMMGQVDVIIEKGLNRNSPQNQILDNVLNYIRGSKAYQDATDQQREEIEREVKKSFGEKMKSAPSATKVLGLSQNIKTITMALSKYHQQRYEDMEKAEANKEKAIKKASKELVASLKYLVRKGQVSTKQMATVLRKFAKTNVLSKSSVKEFTDYMTKVFNDAEYANKLSEANKLKKIISRASKNKSNVYDANLVKLAEQFKKIDPSMVDNIDQYIKMASELKEAIRGTTAVKGKVRFANTVKISDFNDYVNTTMESQKEKIMEQLRQQVQDLLGIDASTLSYEELIDKLNETGSVSLSKENEEAVRGAVEDMFKVYSDAINNMLSSEDIDIKESKIKLVERFMKMDLSKMKIKDAIYAVDALNNFIVNGSTAKMEKVLNEYEGQRAGELLQEKNIKADVPKIYRTKWGARNFIRYFQTVPMMIENFFKGSKSIFFEKVTGIRDLISHKSEAQRIVNVILKDYTDTFYKLKPNGQKFNTAFNNIERSMLAYVSRAKAGKEGKSFKDRKSLIEQSIENLRTGNEAQQKKADLYQQVYDKILKDSKSSEEVRDKVDPINADAFDYWVDKWAKFYDELADVSENIHNKILGKDIFYTPDKVSKLNPEEVNELGDMTGSAFHTNSGVVYKKKTGRLEESTLENKLPDGSYIDLSFDNNNASLLLDALIDIKTAGDVAKLNAFLKSDSFKKIFPNAEIREVFVKRLDTMIRNFRGKNHFQDDDSRALSRFINRTGGLSSAIALTSGFQLLKQTVSVATNTLINVGRPHIGYVFNKAKRDFINNSGEAIANRGTESQADINAIDSLVSQAAESKGEKALQFIEKANKLFLSAVLKHPDVWIAKASWFAYYEKGLKKQGIDAKNINYSDHELNKEAAQYAQKMVDRQQNISDADLKGEFFSSKNTANVLMSKVLFPLASFRINAWSRMNLDLRTIANKNISFEDRKDAIYSLMGGVAEAAVFNAIGIWATGTMYGWAMGMIRGGDDDDDKEKQKERDEKYADSILRGRLSQFTNDMLSPIPLTDWLAETAVFETIDLIQDLKGVKEDNRLNIFEPPDIDEPQKATKYLGAFGILLDRFKESKDIIKASITGKIVEKKFGEETVKYVNPKDKEVLSTIAKLAVLNGLGLLPADINNLQKNIFREIKKQASTKTEAELIQEKASKAERRAEKNEKIDLINQAITKAPNQRVADELMKMRADAIEDLSTEKKSDEEKEALKKKRESEKASYKNLLGGYDTKDDLKRYDPELYERNFGENSDYYKAHKFEQEAEKLLDKVEQKNKDLQYNYQKPSKTKSRFFNSDGTSKKSSHFNRFSSK